MIGFVIPQRKANQNQNPNGRNDAWGFVGAGGGGAMFNPTVSPHDPDYAFVRCDMTGAYVTYNGGESWRMFNLRSPVRRFVFDPQNTNVIYANSIALTWQPLNGDAPDTGILVRGTAIAASWLPAQVLRI